MEKNEVKLHIDGNFSRFDVLFVVLYFRCVRFLRLRESSLEREILFYLFFPSPGSPDRDENDKIIEDEFSGMPVVQQWCFRFYHKIRHFKKVSVKVLIKFVRMILL